MDISAGLISAIAGIGILSGIRSVPDSSWAIVAFCSGIVGQMRSVFGIASLEVDHRKLQNDYGSVLSVLKGIVDRAKDAGGLTHDLNVERKLVLERFNFVTERDDTDYDVQRLHKLQDKINKMYPADRLWMPSRSALEG